MFMNVLSLGGRRGAYGVGKKSRFGDFVYDLFGKRANPEL